MNKFFAHQCAKHRYAVAEILVVLMFSHLQALLGAQLVMTLIMVSVIQKLSPHYSLAKWILCSTGLIRFLHPTDTELKTLAGMQC